MSLRWKGESRAQPPFPWWGCSGQQGPDWIQLLSKCKRIEIISRIFSDYNSMKLEMNTEKETRKKQLQGDQTTCYFKKKQKKKTVGQWWNQRKVKNILKTNGSENKTIQNLCCWYSVTESCPTLCDPHRLQHARLPCPSLSQSLLKLVHWVDDAIQPSHPLSPPSPPPLDLSQHQRLFQWVGSWYHMAKVLQLQFSISPSNEYSGLISFRIN